MHCHTAWGQWAAQLLQCTASLLVGCGQWSSCFAPPHCLGAVGCGTPAKHYLTAWGQRASATPAVHCLTAWGWWTVELLQCAGPPAGGTGSLAQEAVAASIAELLQCTASLPGGSGQCKNCNALPHCLGAVGSGTPVKHCHTAQGQWAVELLQCTASLPGGRGQWNSRNALPHCLGAVGIGTPATHCLTARGQWAVQLLQCHTAWGRWAVELLQCVGPLAGGTGSPAQEAVAALSA